MKVVRDQRVGSTFFRLKEQNQMMKQIENTYISRDFYLSAYLLAEGDELRTYEKDEQNLTRFIFQNSPSLQQHVRKFYALEALVNPIAYGNALRNLKSMIHSSTNLKPNYTNVEQHNRPK